MPKAPFNKQKRTDELTVSITFDFLLMLTVFKTLPAYSLSPVKECGPFETDFTCATAKDLLTSSNLDLL